MLAVFAGEIARELHVGGLRDRVGAEHRRALQAADRGDDGDRAVLALDHLRRDQRDQPVIGDDVVVENLAELVVGNARLRAVIGIGRGVANQRVDLSEDAVGFLDQIFKSSLVEMLAATESAILLPALSLIAFATSSQAACLREEITTLAPC